MYHVYAIIVLEFCVILRAILSGTIWLVSYAYQSASWSAPGCPRIEDRTSGGPGVRPNRL